MKCKYCSAPISETGTKCPVCGADIDIFDGGQSFFEDEDLNMWLTGEAPKASANPMKAEEYAPTQNDPPLTVQDSDLPPTQKYSDKQDDHKAKHAKKTAKSLPKPLIIGVAVIFALALVLLVWYGISMSKISVTETTQTDGASPSGEQMSEVQPEEPDGAAAQPAEDVAQIDGEAVQPAEDAAQTDGEAVQPAEDAAQTDGAAVQPAEDAAQTDGEAVQPAEN